MKEDEDLTKDLYEALKETMDKLKEVYFVSAFYQHSEYTAKNNGTKNWFFNAMLALEKYEKINQISNT